MAATVYATGTRKDVCIFKFFARPQSPSWAPSSQLRELSGALSTALQRGMRRAGDIEILCLLVTDALDLHLAWLGSRQVERKARLRRNFLLWSPQKARRIFSAPYQHSTRLAFWSFRHVCKCNESGMFPMEIIAHPRGPRNYLQFARGGSRCMKDLVRNRKGLQVSGGGIQPTRQKQVTVGMCFNQITTLYTFRTPVGCVLWIRMLAKGLKQQLGWKSNVPCSHCLAQKLMMFVSLSGEVSAPNIASCDRHCGHRHLRGQLAGMGAPNGSLM